MRFARLGIEPVLASAGAHLNRARTHHQRPLAVGHLLAECLQRLRAHFIVGGEVFGGRHVGHRRSLMGQAILGALETGGEVEDRCAALACHDAAVGEAAAIEVALRRVVDRRAFLASAQEIGVERMGLLAVLDGRLRRLKRLRNHLPAEHTAHAARLRLSDKSVIGGSLEAQQLDQSVGQLSCSFFFGRCGRSRIHAPSNAQVARQNQRSRM